MTHTHLAACGHVYICENRAHDGNYHNCPTTDRELCDRCEEDACNDCSNARKHAYSDATTPGFFYDRCTKHQGRIGTMPEEIAAKHEQQQKMQGKEWTCECLYCVKVRDLKLINDRRINPKGVRGQ